MNIELNTSTPNIERGKDYLLHLKDGRWIIARKGQPFERIKEGEDLHEFVARRNQVDCQFFQVMTGTNPIYPHQIQGWAILP